ncbi:MAG: hypothetical protein LKJ99_04830 [Acidaminococcaceae bacterium]|nr:hypothetical protein [Acidaminococcaceae bacterium]MCI2110281.1 hypothetical protein [Acidaminococcaceae bacterium]
MLKRILVMLTLCTMFLSTASAMSTKDKYDQSNVCVITMENNVELGAEPNGSSLVLGTYPKGTVFVPINQYRNETENKLYNLVIRSDGAIGWVLASQVAITHK